MKRNFFKAAVKCILALFCLCGLVFSFFLYERIHCNHISHKAILCARQRIALLSKEDRKALSVFFHNGISISSYGHTLLEQKPMSLLIVLDPDTKESEDPEIANPYDLTTRGYEVWRKHRDWFPENKYMFVEFVSHIDKKTPLVGLIHVKLCKATIAKHLSDFQHVIDKPLSPEEIFAILINPSHEKFDAIINNDFLQGILYGYGRNNAYLYDQKIRSKLSHFLAKRYALDRYIRLGSKIYFLCPSFFCDSTTEETQNLHRLYDEGCKLLYWTYLGRDFLETTLAFFYTEVD